MTTEEKLLVEAEHRGFKFRLYGSYTNLSRYDLQLIEPSSYHKSGMYRLHHGMRTPITESNGADLEMTLDNYPEYRSADIYPVHVKVSNLPPQASDFFIEDIIKSRVKKRFQEIAKEFADIVDELIEANTEKLQEHYIRVGLSAEAKMLDKLRVKLEYPNTHVAVEAMREAMKEAGIFTNDYQIKNFIEELQKPKGSDLPGRGGRG